MKRLLVCAGFLALALVSCRKDIIPDDGSSSGESTSSQEGTLTDPALAWSAASCDAVLGYANSFPTLSNPKGVTVIYSSSATEVAAIDRGTGEIILIGTGTTTITAKSEATSEYSFGLASYELTVTAPVSSLESAGLAWSASSFTATLESADNAYPTLSNPHSLEVSYKSTDTGVATIGADGTVTALKTGSATIIATSEPTDEYDAGSASYNLYVISSADPGAGTFSFPSSGDPSSEDDIANSTFTREISIVWSSSGVSVEGDAKGFVSVSGGNVTANNTGDECIVYRLSGSSSDGSFKLYSSRKQAIVLDGLTLACSSGAAINNQSPKRTFFVIEGVNSLADYSSSAYTSTTEDMKGVVFSEGQLVLSGSGSLEVKANNSQSKDGLVSDDYVRIMNSPALTITGGSSAGNGIRANDYVRVDGGSCSISLSAGVRYDSDDKEYKGTSGIKAGDYFALTGGSVTIKHTGSGGKGINAGSYDYDSKSHTLSDSYISGGVLNVTTTGSESNDVSAKGVKIGWVTKNGSGEHATVTGNAGNMNISGGQITVSSSKSEAFEVKGDLNISGGSLYAYSTGDDAINSQGHLTVTGGFVYGHSTQNDGIDSNGNTKLSGGYIFGICTKGTPEVAIDANTEGGYKLYIYSGATVVAYGGLESGYTSENTVKLMSCSAGSWNALWNGSSFIAAFKAPSGISSVAVVAPSLSSGYTGVSVSGSTQCNGIWATSGISGGTSVTLGTYSGGSGGGPGGWPGGGGGGGGGRPW